MNPLLSLFRGFFLALSLLTLTWQVQAASATVDVQQAAKMQSQGVLLIDVREPDEYAQVHAPGSRLIPLSQLPQRIKELQAAKDQPIALICRSGNRSGQAQQLLEQAGFSKTVNVQGGMNAWGKAGLPLATGPAAN